MQKNLKMLERIQTIFLAIVGLCLILAIFLPTWEKENTDKNESVTLNYMELSHIKNGDKVKGISTLYVMVLAGLSGLIAFYSLSQYKNRMLQMKLGFLNTLLMCGVLLFSVYFAQDAENILPEPAGEPWQYYRIGFYLPIIALLSNLAANRFIRRDEKLVRDSDRMR